MSISEQRWALLKEYEAEDRDEEWQPPLPPPPDIRNVVFMTQAQFDSFPSVIPESMANLSGMATLTVRIMASEANAAAMNRLAQAQRGDSIQESQSESDT